MHYWLYFYCTSDPDFISKAEGLLPRPSDPDVMPSYCILPIRKIGKRMLYGIASIENIAVFLAEFPEYADATHEDRTALYEFFFLHIVRRSITRKNMDIVISYLLDQHEFARDVAREFLDVIIVASELELRDA